MMRRSQLLVILSTLFLGGGSAVCYLGTDGGSPSADGPPQQQRPIEPPPPPPALSPESEGAATIHEEPARKLSASARQELRQLEGVLPPECVILRYPSSPEIDQLAVVSAVLDSEGQSRTVIIYREPEVTPLSMSVVESRGDRRTIATARLAGSNPVGIINGQVMPVSVFDVTGDGILDLVAVSGIGASAGSVLQIFTLEGSNLRAIGEIGGHYFEVASQKGKRIAIVRARYQEDESWRQLTWNGTGFDELP